MKLPKHMKSQLGCSNISWNIPPMGGPNVEPQDNLKKRILKIEALNADAIGILRLNASYCFQWEPTKSLIIHDCFDTIWHCLKWGTAW